MSVLTKKNAEGVLAGFKIRKPSEIAEGESRVKGEVILLYSRAGGGKTLLASSIREIGKTIHMNMDAGTDVIEDVDVDDYTIVDLETYEEVVKLIERIRTDGPDDFANIVFDNGTEFINMAEIKFGGGGQLEFKEWNQLTRDIQKQFRRLRDIANRYGVNVIITFWDDEEKDARGRWKQQLEATPKLKNVIPGIVTTVAHIDLLDSDPTKRRLNFAPSNTTINKFRRSANATAQEVPFVIEYGVDNMPLVDILRTIKGEIKWPKSKYGSSNNLRTKRSTGENE